MFVEWSRLVYLPHTSSQRRHLFQISDKNVCAFIRSLEKEKEKLEVTVLA